MIFTKIHQLTISLFLLTIPATFAETDFSYANAENWEDRNPSCGGQEQSPIDINTDHALFDRSLDGSFSMSDTFFQPIASSVLENTGQTYKLTPTDLNIRILGGGGLDAYPLTFHSLTFHFGSEDNLEGAEHTIDGHRYPAEMQLLFRNENIPELQKGSYVIWSFFFEILTDNEKYRRGGSFDTIITALQSVHSSGGSTTVNNIKLSSLVPIFDAWSFNRFYSYHGSLSAPPCTQNVQWFIFKDPLAISKQQYLELVKGMDNDDEPLVNNFRPIQDIGNRLITRTGLANKVIRGPMAFANDVKVNYVIVIFSLAIMNAMLNRF